MIFKEWPIGVNHRVFGLIPSYIDNVIQVESVSGNVITFAKGQRVRRKFTFSLKMTKKEFELFDQWYTREILDGAVPFKFPYLNNDNDLYILNSCDISGGQISRVVTFEVSEV